MRIIICLLAFSLVACTSNLSVPSGILPLKQMQSVLWDMMRADAMINIQSVRDSSLKKISASTNLYQQIFKIQHITKEEFKRSLHYYQSHPALLQPVFDSLYNKASSPVEVHTKSISK